MVTDRVVLDRQLQNTIAQFEQTPGVEGLAGRAALHQLGADEVAAPGVSRPTFVRRLLEEAIKQYRRDSSLQSVIMTNAEDRDRIFNHLFSRALHEVRETPAS